MPHREKNGSIHRPEYTTGWIHWDEIQACVKAKLIDPASITIYEWYRYQPCDCPPPLAKVTDLYALRTKAGKNTPLGIACKLVPNSLYGKFAQSIGSPKYANPVYASLITSRCRIQITDAIATHPKGAKDVVMIATDGIYFRHPHPKLALTSNLGDWEEGLKHNVTLFKPGMYWDDKARANLAAGETVSFKARGVNAKDFSKCLLEIDDQFRQMIAAFSMITATQAQHWGNWSVAGSLVKDPMANQSANPWKKRVFLGVKDGILYSECYPEPTGPNYPYDERFGADDETNPHSLLSREAQGILPEGSPEMIVRETIIE
jgi:hypothetical protein